MTDQATQAVETNPEEALLSALDNSPPEQEEQPAAEGDEGQEGQPEEAPDERAEEKPAVSQKFRVKVKNDQDQDEERDLTLEELAAGYMQSADYTRKTQAAAQQERERQNQYFEAINQTTQQARQQLAALQQFVMASVAPELQELTPQLAATDPARFVQLQAKAMQVQQTLAQIKAQEDQLTEQQKAAIQQRREQARAHSLDILSREIPGFNLEKEGPRLAEAAKRYGYSGEELESISDHRFIALLHKAEQWESLQKAKPKALQKVAEAPKVIKPAAPQPKKTNQAASDRLRKFGRAEDLASFL